MPSDHPDDRDDPRTRRDGPRDRDGDYEDDRPPRRRKDNGAPQNQPLQASALGVLALVQGIGSLFASFIPCVGVLGLVGGAVGLLLGVLGFVLARRSQRTGTGLPIAGIVVNTFAVIIGGGWLLLMALVFNKRDDALPADDGGSITITAVALDQEFDANELAADRKYKGKTLVVSGVVKRITRDDKPGKVTIELSGTPESTVDCHFDRANQGDLGPLVVGQDVTIRGRCRGKVRSYVTLETCALVSEEKKVGPKAPDEPPTEATADALVAEYNGNVVAADTKYKEKVLDVTGKVVRIIRNKPGKVTVEFESELGPTVACDFNSKEAHAQLAELVVGDSVVIRGSCRGTVDEVITLGNCSIVKKVDKPTAGPATAVTLDKISKDYEKNVVSADAKYKGKRLEVSGTVIRIVKNKPGKITVQLGTEERLMMDCDFLAKDGQAQLAEVDAGDKVVIRGTCRGQDFGTLLLENCSVVKE
ncbi:OB-fold protein [Frigoriglobus tundricola]|uniref:Uncharacterized protein n=1 Tax=Frigoriglobus tundricola TaxID=2774151 RepID=A0A6M5YWR9_9BACT|nr:hypothetical protein [Frigoriglobus tundricola]QJW98547.1 hypothetical protein FTUN_6142 [Frigoriglobus tundricola]